MTQEEKARAYDEALDRARALRQEAIDKGYAIDYVKDYEAIFPELAESEDERIRTELLSSFKGIMADADEDELWYGLPYNDIIAWLEKQKENPKSADSIPSDCVSDVKCEDRSPKHSDSDGIDIRDTPAYWRGWDDAMKQKEQKHPDGCFTCDEYKKGYEEGRRNGFTAGYNKAIKEVEQKEQKPTHFELKAGKWYICHRAFCCRADHLTVKEGERFICEKDGVVKGFVIKEPEKYFKECSAPAPMEDEQKEPHYTKRNALFDKCVENCDPEVMKRVSDEIDEMLEKEKQKEPLRDFIDDFPYSDEQKEQKPTDTEWDELQAEFKRINEAFENGKNEVINRPEAFGLQKSVEWSEEDETRLTNILIMLKEYLIHHYSKDDINKSVDWLENRVKFLRPQSNQEWSEEDDKMINTLVSYVEDPSCWNLKYPKEKLVAFIKSLPKRFNLEPKQEWSEEDKAIVNCIACCLDGSFVPEAARKQSLIWFNKHRRDFLNRPSWKPSEQEKGALRTAIYVLTEERNFPKAAEQLQAILDAFDGKEARKDWKPTEEQMEWLESAVKLSTDKPHIHGIIISLYEQLKRLM